MTRALEIPQGASVVVIVAHARSVASDVRELFAKRIEELGRRPGHILVHTCHRAEIYISPATFEAEVPESPAGSAILLDADAVRHAIEVACGLDSAVVGETQILHQLRETIAERKVDVPLDPVLDRLFQTALHAGRAAHTWFSGSPRSLADVALDRIAASTGPLEGLRILVVGAGRMGRLAALAASRRGAAVLVANRDPGRAMRLATDAHGAVVPFGGDAAVPEVDGVVIGISGTWPVSEAAVLALRDGGVPVVDMSSPAALTPRARQLLGTGYVAVDSLADEDGLIDEKLQAKLERLIADSGREYCRWLRARENVPAINAVVRTAEHHRLAEIEWLRHRLTELSDDDLTLVEQMSHRLVAAILHAPLSALNGDASGDLERAARELFGV